MPERDRARFVANILEDAQRMERLVARLLELARLENAPSEVAVPLDPLATAPQLLTRHGPRVALVGEPGLPHAYQ